jgi:hypothetical protein
MPGDPRDPPAPPPDCIGPCRPRPQPIPVDFLDNGTVGRLRIEIKSLEQLLAEAQQRYADHVSGKWPLSPRESVELREEIDRLSIAINPRAQNLWGPLTPAEEAYVAARAAKFRNDARTLAFWACGLPCLPAAAARAAGAPEEAVDGIAEISLNLTMALEGTGPREVSGPPPLGRRPAEAIVEPLVREPVSGRPPGPKPAKPAEPARPAEPAPRPAEPAPRPAEKPAAPPEGTFVAIRKPSKAQLKEEANNRAIDEILRKEGKKVEPNPDEGASGAGRQGDRIVDGKKTEYKTLQPGAKESTIKNVVNRSIADGGQARDMIINARGSGLTLEQATRGLDLAWGASRNKLDSLRVIGDGFNLTKP